MNRFIRRCRAGEGPEPVEGAAVLEQEPEHLPGQRRRPLVDGDVGPGHEPAVPLPAEAPEQVDVADVDVAGTGGQRQALALELEAQHADEGVEPDGIAAGPRSPSS